MGSHVTTLTVLAASGVAFGVAGVLVAGLAHVRATRLRREYTARIREFRAVTGPVDPRGIRNVAVTHYDAFSDMGGRMSFSLALLDGTGDGVVLSSINAHSEARTYAKVIQAGDSTQTLSPEERQVLARARDGVPGRPDESGRSVVRGVMGTPSESVTLDEVPE